MYMANIGIGQITWRTMTAMHQTNPSPRELVLGLFTYCNWTIFPHLDKCLTCRTEGFQGQAGFPEHQAQGHRQHQGLISHCQYVCHHSSLRSTSMPSCFFFPLSSLASLRLYRSATIPMPPPKLSYWQLWWPWWRKTAGCFHPMGYREKEQVEGCCLLLTALLGIISSLSTLPRWIFIANLDIGRTTWRDTSTKVMMWVHLLGSWFGVVDLPNQFFHLLARIVQIPAKILRAGETVQGVGRGHHWR